MQKKIDLKKITIASIIIAAVIIMIVIIRSCGTSGNQQFEFAKATIGRVKRTISVTGVIEVKESQRVLSKMSGIVNRVYVDFNDAVRRGQILATIDSIEIDQKLMKLASQLESVNLELDIAREELAGKKSLFKENLISKTAMQKAELDYKSVMMKHKQVQLDYNLALKQKDNTRIASPLSGIVISREIDENIPTDITKTLFVVAPSLRDMRLLISVDESDIGIIRKDQVVNFTVSAYPDEKFEGKIGQIRINPIPKGGLVSYQSIVVCDNNRMLLKPGMTATATIVVNDKDKTLCVPNQAFYVSPIDMEYESGKKFLWVKTNRLVNGLPMTRIEVETGIRGDLFTEVTKNLKAGDEVLVKVTKKDSNGSK
ncbi:MAG: efflux RND transporter periplasmic adaptor subunit [Spirochaetes bacterium]|nr:efflux RND transporter periplasmic adaptor subunit [Spirochaetota bacterium]